MLDAAVVKLLEYGGAAGIGGVMFVLLLYAIKKLVDVVNKREATIAGLQEQIKDLQEKRIAEAMKSVVVLEEASAAVESNASVLRQVERVMDMFSPEAIRALERLSGRRARG